MKTSWQPVGFSSIILLSWLGHRLVCPRQWISRLFFSHFGLAEGGRGREARRQPGSSANRSGCPFISRRELFAIVGDGKGSPGSSASFGSSPMPAKYVNSRYLHTRWTSLVFVSASVYMCVCRVRDRSNYRIPLRIGWSRIRNEIKQRGIYRSRRGINTILMKIRQLGGSILSRLSNLDLKNPDLFVIAGKKEGGRWISRELARWYSLIGIQFHSSFFSVFRSSVTRRGGGGEFIFSEWRKNGCKIRWSFSIISWIVEITGRGVGEGRLLFSFFNSTGKLVPRSPPVLCCRLSLLVAKPRPRI